MAATILKALAVAEELAWSTPQTTGYVRLPAEDIAFAPGIEYLPRAIQSTRLGEKHPGVIGAQGGTLSFKLGLHGLKTAASVLGVEHDWMPPLLKGCGFGRVGAAVGTGSKTTGAASTTTKIDLTAATGFDVGGVAVIGGEARLITAVDAVATPKSITVSPALSAAPATGVDVFSSASWTINTSSKPGASLTFLGKGDGYEYVFRGCNGTITLESATANARPMLAVTINVDGFTRDASGISLPAMAALPSAIVLKSSPFWWGPEKRAVREFSFDPAVAVVAQMSTEGANGRSAWMLSDAVPAGAFTAYRSGSATDALQADYETPTQRTMIAQLGSAPGAMFVIAADKAQIVAYPVEGDADGLVSLPVSVEVKAPSAGMPVFTMAFC